MANLAQTVTMDISIQVDWCIALFVLVTRPPYTEVPHLAVSESGNNLTTVFKHR
jgi:hypothetical protein